MRASPVVHKVTEHSYKSTYSSSPVPHSKNHLSPDVEYVTKRSLHSPMREDWGFSNKSESASSKFNKLTMSDSYQRNNYSSSSKFLPIDDDVQGAKAIKVNNKPDGYLGQPFEFESELEVFSNWSPADDRLSR